MNPAPDAKMITFPQWVAEMVIFWRCKFLKDWKSVRRGPGWYQQVPKSVARLNHQAIKLCDQFDDPEDNPLVKVAFANYFKREKPLSLGFFYKTPGKKSAEERRIITGVKRELEDLTRHIDAQEVQSQDSPVKSDGPVTFRTPKSSSSKMSKLLEMERNG